MASVWCVRGRAVERKEGGVGKGEKEKASVLVCDMTHPYV